MKTLLSCLTILALSGCAVAVSPPRVTVAPAGVYVPSGVTYVAPTYAIPEPGYTWRYHEHYGWGWYHPQYGWHRGWR